MPVLSLPKWRRLIHRAERATLSRYNFIRNVSYYFFDRKFTWEQAVRTARNTL